MPAFFSIVIATFNRAPTLSRAIDSALAQTDPDWELLIVDDGSTDETEAIVAPYLRDRRIIWLPGVHEGVWATKNAGAAEAHGRWITFLDSDDAYTPTHLAERRRAIAEHPAARFIHGGFLVLGPPEMQFVADADDPTRLVSLADCAVGGTFVIESRSWHALGGFPAGVWAADTALFRAATTRGADFVVRCEAATYLYIRRPGIGVCEEMRISRASSS